MNSSHLLGVRASAMCHLCSRKYSGNGDKDVCLRNLVFPILQLDEEHSKVLSDTIDPRCEKPGSLNYHVEENHQLTRTIHTGLIYM